MLPVPALPATRSFVTLRTWGKPASNQQACLLNSLLRLIPTPFDERVRSGIDIKQGSDLPDTADHRVSTRGDLAWAISVGGIGVVAFAALLLFAWYFAATLFLIFAGMLLGVALNAMTNLLGRVVQLPHALRLTIVCLVLASLLSGVVFLGGSTIAQQAKVLSDTIKSQLVNVKAFLEQHGIDASYFALGNASAASSPSSASTTPGAAAARNIPGADALASSGTSIISQTLKLLLGTVSAVGNFFIVLFLGLAFAAQPGIYRSGLLFMAPAKHRKQTIEIVDRI